MRIKRFFLIFCILSCILTVSFLHAQNIPNPVLPRVADAGVLRYNGKYYIGGVFTNGDLYISKDLVKWEGPVHVFSMDNDWTRGMGAGDDQIHANDIRYLNGEFHMYWSVNYWGKDKHAVHIAHAVADDVLGPYVEPEKETWMDNRIDPMVFRDDDGKLYMYQVRFTDGNTIWVRPMKDWATFNGHPIYQFASLPGTWETMDSRVAEGPWVIKYRDRYYMIYNANHTSTVWGNYQFGVAEADSPTSFNHGNKYSYPLLGSNQTTLEENYPDLLLFNQEMYDPFFSYTEEKPETGWQQNTFDASGWKKGKGGFAARHIEGSTTRKQGTVWNSPELYIRKSFEVNPHTGNLALRVTHSGDTRVYLNGKIVYEQQGSGYYIINLDEEQQTALQTGKNLLTAETKGGGNQYFNVSLFDMQNEVADDILYSPGQPNVLRGPNGFEWWLIYMADQSRERRSQYINRVHFFDKTLYMEGITGKNTQGYFPTPSSPTYGDTFDDETNWNTHWRFSPDWKIKDGELVVKTNGLQEAIADEKYKSTACYYEAGVKTSSCAGLIPFRKDKDNWVRVGLDANSRCWFMENCRHGKSEITSFALPDDFRFDVYHTLTVERNYTTLTIRMDEIPAPGQSVFSSTVSGEGVPGLFAENGEASFDGIVYTQGWDESEYRIEGWQEKGTSQLTNRGLQITSHSYHATKGDKLEQYEYSIQVSNEYGSGIAGIYPLYADGKNYVKAGINYETGQLEVTVVKKGKEISREDYPVEHLQTHYADMKYTDFIERAFYFRYPTLVNEIRLNRMASYDNNLFVDNLFEKVATEYLANGKWYPLATENAVVSPHPSWKSISFEPHKMEAIRFINKGAEDQQSYIYKIRVNELLRDSYNLRCVRLKDTLILFIDGREICRLKTDFPETAVGLFSEKSTPVYNGILRYHIPE